MVVISAGVVMNLITAALVFITVFMVGLRVEPAVIGAVSPTSPSATAVATNADALGVSAPGLQTGDVAIRINDTTPAPYHALIVAPAMAGPRQPVRLRPARPAVHTHPLPHLPPLTRQPWYQPLPE